jgi:rhodanese-related sulfurtransferase
MRTITVQKLKERLDNGDTLNILDVREPAEYAEINMGAKLIPLGQIASAQIEDIEDLRDQEVIIHCRSGMRSMQACMILEQLGFTNTVNVEGGILAWQAAYGS